MEGYMLDSQITVGENPLLYWKTNTKFPWLVAGSTRLPCCPRDERS